MSVAVSLQADSPTHPHSESSLGAGSPTQQCQNSPPEGESSIQPPRRKLSYPNHGVADREGARGGGVPPSDRRGKKEGSPLLDMPDLSQTQKVYFQSSPLSQASTSVPLPSSQVSGAHTQTYAITYLSLSVQPWLLFCISSGASMGPDLTNYAHTLRLN